MQEGQRPKLIIVGGVSAAGKSTFARQLEKELALPRVSMDELKEQLFDYVGTRDRQWSREIGRIAWPAFKEVVELYVSRSESVIAEATFLWPDDREWIEALAETCDLDVIQIWMTADPRIVRERFIARANSEERHPGHCDALHEVLQEFEERLFNRSYIPHPLRGRTIVVDTTDFSSVDFHHIIQSLFKERK